MSLGDHFHPPLSTIRHWESFHAAWATTAWLYTVAYRPRRSAAGDQVELWLESLKLGKTLPTMPLALRGVGTIPVDLQGTYERTCEDSRLA